MMKKSNFSPRLLDAQANRQRFTSFSKHIQQSRRPRSSTGQQQYQKMIKTMYLMTNIQRAVKQNDLKFLIGEKRSKLRAQPQNKMNIQQSAHQALIDARKKYDEMKRQRQKNQQKNQKLKEVIGKYYKQQHQWSKKLGDGRKKSMSQQIFVDDIGQTLQCKLMDKNVMQNMCCRLKQDIQYYKKKIVITKRNLALFQFNIKGMKTQSQNLHKQTGNAGNLLNKLKINLNQQDQDRIQHLYNLQNMIDDKQLKQKTQKQRQQQYVLDAQKTSLAKSQQQISWNSLLLTHFFIKKILQNKMRKQMDKFSIVQAAFINIKSGTDIKDPETLVNRYLERQNIYGQLLSQVAKTKSRHHQLKNQYKMLEAEYQQLSKVNQKLSNIQYSTISFVQIIPLKNPQSLQLHTKQINTLRIKMNEWLIHQLQKISQNDKRCQISNQILIEMKDNTVQLFKLYLDNLDDLIQKTQFQQSNWFMTMPQFIIPFQTNNSYQTTVKNKLEVKNSKMFNHLDDQFIWKSDIKQLDHQTYKIEDQIMTISTQRQEIHKGNQKFMRDIRIKFIQAKRKKVQKQTNIINKRIQ